MSLNSKGLGRGLDALFQGNQTPAPTESGASESQFQLVPIDSLSPNPRQPRENFSEETLKELSDSIREKGILQPLLVRPGHEPQTWEIIAGERRWRAARLAGLERVPVVTREMDDNDAMIAAYIENVQRDDLNPIERAKALVALKKALGIGQDELADRLGQSRGTIGNMIRLINLDEDSQEAVIEGHINFSQARALLAVPRGVPMETLREHIIEFGMTSRDAEEAARFWNENGRFPWEREARPRGARKTPNLDLKNMGKDLSALWNCKAKVSGNGERGRISLLYESTEQLNEILDKLGVSLPARPNQ